MALPEIFQKVCTRKGWAVQDNDIDILLQGDRMQRISIVLFKHEGASMIRAFSKIGTGEALSESRLASALRLNFSMPHGAVALNEGMLVLTDTFLLKDADEGEVEASLEFLATTADRYEKLIYGGDQH